ncbi:hypothetical protein ACIR03_05005 [Clostridium cochlearium]|nr:hypothetical protein [Clostridium cochlearium]
MYASNLLFLLTPSRGLIPVVFSSRYLDIVRLSRLKALAILLSR